MKKATPNKAAQILGRLGAIARSKKFKHKDFVAWGKSGGRGNKKLTPK